MMWALLILPLLYVLTQLWQVFILFRYKSRSIKAISASDLPHVSIWVACRNEEENLPACLDALLNVSYPLDKVQILIGNDQSTDRTQDIIDFYAKNHPQIKSIPIIDDGSALQAKARVMAQLDQHADGMFYLITDADVRVNPLWIQGLLSNMDEDMGVCSGTTMVRSKGIDGWLQELDWSYFMGLLNIISYSGVPATAVGNNMIIRKEAYWATGGYAQITFSITEDYKLYSEICKRAWKWNNIMNPETLAFSEKTRGLNNLLHQRKRWLSGGKELPWYWWVLFGIYGSFYFVSPTLLTYFFITKDVTGVLSVLCLWLIKWILQSIQIRKIYKLIGEDKPNIGRLVIYEIYLSVLTLLTAIFFALPLPTRWKGRNYKV